MAAAVATTCRAPPEFSEYGNELRARERLRTPNSASSPTARDGGWFGVASLRIIAPAAAAVVSFADTLAHLLALDCTAALVADSNSFLTSPSSPALRELAPHFTAITSEATRS
jgi:hypothetical protein